MVVYGGCGVKPVPADLQGRARHSRAGLGVAGLDVVGQGLAWRGAARYGMARSNNYLAWHGEARRVLARPSWVRYGVARSGLAGQDLARQG